MKLLRTMILLMMVMILTNCTKIKFDGYDPSTALVRWIITNDTRD